MIRTRKKMRLCLTLLACNLIFIWGNSLLPGELSGQLSNWVKDILARFVSFGADDGTSGGLLRKLAHFTEFAALGALLSWLFAMLRQRKVLPFLCGAGAACIDETIQMFVPDRGPGIRDVLIDCSGVTVGMLLLYAGHALYEKTRNKSLEETTL